MTELDRSDFEVLGGEQDTPEGRLLCAVLVRAIADLLDTDKEISRDARKWFLKKEDFKPFSFRWVCSIRGISPTYLVGKLKRAGCFESDIKDRPLELRKRLGSFISS